MLDKKTIDAMEAMVVIATHQGDSPVSGKMIAETLNHPPRYLEQMLQRLVHAELLRGVRGPRGGYVLSREKRRISLADILLALQEPSEKNRDDKAVPLLHQKLKTVEKHLLDGLQTITLQELTVHSQTIREESLQKTANYAI